jgi:hypothetical protein
VPRLSEPCGFDSRLSYQSQSLCVRPRHMGDVALLACCKRYAGVGGPRTRHVLRKLLLTARDKWKEPLVGEPQAVFAGKRRRTFSTQGERHEIPKT